MCADTTTTNYGWVKPGVNDPAGVDAWGGKLNTDLDGIDAQVFTNAQSVASLWQNIRYRNRIINGDMSVDQRNGGAQIAAPATAAYIIDRWKLGVNIASKGNVGQNAIQEAGITTTGFLYDLYWTTTVAYTPAAADFLFWSHFVEGYNFNDANWGTANALPVTLEFWAWATAAGTYAVSLRNNAYTRSYVATYTLPASTWTKIRLNISGDTTGTWAVAANAYSCNLSFNLGSGSTYTTTTPNAWQAGNFLAAAGVVNPVATLNFQYLITGVALMVGAAAQNAEPEFRKYSDNLLDCMRYYTLLGQFMAALTYSGGGSQATSSTAFPVVMRAAPTNTLSGMTYSGCTGTTVTISTNQAFRVNLTGVTANAGAFAIGNFAFDADF